MHFAWFMVYGLMCECTEGCCEVCTECRVPVEVGLPILLLVLVFPHLLFRVQMVLAEEEVSQITKMFSFPNFLVCT